MIAAVAENGFELLVTIGARETDHLDTQVYRHCLLLRLRSDYGKAANSEPRVNAISAKDAALRSVA